MLDDDDPSCNSTQEVVSDDDTDMGFCSFEGDDYPLEGEDDEDGEDEDEEE